MIDFNLHKCTLEGNARLHVSLTLEMRLNSPCTTEGISFIHSVLCISYHDSLWFAISVDRSQGLIRRLKKFKILS